MNEKELLLLSNYVYLDKCTEYGTIGEMLDSCRSENGWIDENKAAQLGISGGMTEAECRKLLQEMDNAPEEFKSLSVVRSINEPELRAVCFAGPSSDDSATVVFRGTGGTYKAWADNVRGSYMQDTEIQKMADDFVRYDCGVYDNLTVSGHSKGGNLAGYTAVLNRDRVRSCVAFDPQGYGLDFNRGYERSIKDASYNIKVVCAHNDIVNPLLIQVAKEIVYVKNDRGGAVGRHGSFSLLDACRFDEDGNIVNATAEREFIMEQLSRLTICATALMNILPDGGNEKISELLAAVAAGALADDVDSEYKSERIRNAVSELSRYCLRTIGLGTEAGMGITTVADSIYADTEAMKNVTQMLGEIHDEFLEIIDRLTSARLSINYRAAGRLAVDTRLKMLEGRLEEESSKLNDYRVCLEEITGLIEGCEKEITGRVGLVKIS